MAMDSTKQQKPQAISALQFLLPISAIFLLTSYHVSFYYHLPSFFLNFSSLNIDRTTMFLFCNAILLFLARDSGLLSFSSSVDKLYDEMFPKRPQAQSSTRTRSEEISLDHVEDKKTVADIEDDGSLQLAVVEEQIGEKEIDSLAAVADVQESHQNDDLDELNRRFEEFIERVKEERRLEALRLI